MKRYVLDTNALIIHFEGRNGADKVQQLIEKAAAGDAELYMSAVNLGEVFFTVWKFHGETYARQAVQSTLNSGVIVVEATLSNVLESAEIKARYHIGYADSFAATVAIKKKAIVVTADTDFRRLADILKVLWLPGSKKIN